MRYTLMSPSGPNPDNPPRPGWFKDPGARFDYRYWDGKGWTEHVSTAGVTSISPLPTETTVMHDWPYIDIQQAEVLNGALDRFFACDTVGGAQEPVETLTHLSGSQGWNPTRSIWIWLAAWASTARVNGSQLTAAKIAFFTTEWHDSFMPQSGTAWMSLGKATPEQRATISNGAFDACPDLDAETVVAWRSDFTVTVRQLRGHLSRELGRPVDQAAPRQASSEEDGGSLLDALSAAEAGDEVQGLMVAAVVADADGDKNRALALLERAASLANVDAMVEAGAMAGQLGDVVRSRHWAEAAARRGSPAGMYNLAVIDLQSGDRRAAAAGFRRAVEAGNHWGYAALVDLAEQDGDHVAARRWAAAGAEVDNPRCLQVHANHLLHDDPSNTSGVLALLEKAGSLGNPDAMVQAGIIHHHLGNGPQARHWLIKADEAGVTDARTILLKYGLA
jgi:hypothetical protein